jgi:hypothetical protein
MLLISYSTYVGLSPVGSSVEFSAGFGESALFDVVKTRRILQQSLHNLFDVVKTRRILQQSLHNLFEDLESIFIITIFGCVDHYGQNN